MKITATGFDHCDVHACPNAADIILDTINYDRFCAGHFDVAKTFAQSLSVPPRWFNVIEAATYDRKRNLVTFTALEFDTPEHAAHVASCTTGCRHTA